MTVFSVDSTFENTQTTFPQLQEYRLIERLYSGVHTVVYRAVEESGEGTEDASSCHYEAVAERSA